MHLSSIEIENFRSLTRLNIASLSDGANHEAADVLFAKIGRVRSDFASLDGSTWKGKFVQACENSLAQRQQEWALSWRINCSGKQFFKDLYVECGIPVAPLTLKRRLVQENKLANGIQGTESWRLLSTTMKDLLSTMGR